MEALEKKGAPKLNPMGTLLFGDLKFQGGYGRTNTSSFVGTLGGPFPPATITGADVYRVGINYSGKPILRDLLGVFRMSKENSAMPAFWDLLINPIQFDAGVSYARTLKTKERVFTKDLTEDTIYQVGISYVLKIDTLMQYVDYFRYQESK